MPGSSRASEAESMHSSRLSLSGLVNNNRPPSRTQSVASSEQGSQVFNPPGRAAGRLSGAASACSETTSERIFGAEIQRTPQPKLSTISETMDVTLTPKKVRTEKNEQTQKSVREYNATDKKSQQVQKHKKGQAGAATVKKRSSCKDDLMTESEVQNMTQILGERLGQKFSTVRNAFTGCGGGDGEGISRKEMQNICRICGFSARESNRYYSTLDQDGSSDLDYAEFRETFGPWITPDWEAPDFKTVKTTSHYTHTLGAHDPAVKASVEHLDRDEALDFSNKGLDKREYDALCTAIGLQMGQRYPRGGGLDMGAAKPFKSPENVWAGGGATGMNMAVTHAFRDIDRSGDGNLGRKEIRRFFEMYNYPVTLADRFYHEMPRNERGQVGFKEFSSQFTRHFGHTQDVAKEHSQTSNNNAIFNRFILRLCHEPPKKKVQPKAQWK